jgi:hypothetical protein
MEEREDENCRKVLAYKAKKNNEDVKILDDLDINFKRFAAGWIDKVKDSENVFEKFIFLWFTFNSWLSLVVPDENKNDNDQYLLHTIATSDRFDDRFDSLLGKDNQFAESARELAAKGPIFRVIWMKNRGIDPWNQEEKERLSYVKMLYQMGPFLKTEHGPRAQFSPECAFKYHIKLGSQIPCDWLHIMHMIYQIRCNLFHGGKTYDSNRDERFVTLAFNVLWPMFRLEGFIKNLELKNF